MSLKLQRDRRTGIYRITGTQVLPGQKVGERIRESTRTTDRAEAERYLEAVRKRLIDGVTLGAAGVYTVADAIEYYLEKGGEATFLAPINEQFGQTRVADLSDFDVSRFATTHYGHLKPASVKRVYYTPLNALIRRSADKGLCPARRFEPPKVVREPARYASEVWWQAFQPHANPDLLRLVMFMMTTSARVTEALNLIPLDVDLPAETALLRKTKNGKPRQVYLSPLVRASLASLMDGKGPQERIFPYSTKRSVNQALERAAKRAGVEYLSSHEVGRHTFAARFLAAGHSLKALQEAGGWASIQLVAETYGHLERSHVEAAIRDVGSRIGFTPETATRAVAPVKALTNEPVTFPVELVQTLENNGGR